MGPAGQCLNISGEYNILNSYLPSHFKEKSYLPCSQFTKFIPVKERWKNSETIYKEEKNFNVIHTLKPIVDGWRRNRFKPSSKIFSWTFQGVASFVDHLCNFCLVFVTLLWALSIDALWSPAGKGLTSRLWFVMSNCEVVTFPLVSWVRCGVWLYRFLTFALFLTLRLINMYFEKQKDREKYHEPLLSSFAFRDTIRVSNDLVLILCKGYLQRTKVATSKERVKYLKRSCDDDYSNVAATNGRILTFSQQKFILKIKALRVLKRCH